MTDLVACLGSGKGTWAEVMKVVESPSWERVFLVMPLFFAQKFQNLKKNCTIVPIDETKDLQEIIAALQNSFDGKFFGDVAVNIISGSGKEHMAVIAALLKAGCGIRLVAHTEKDGLKEL